MEDLKGICQLQLNSISPVENDCTLVKMTFSVLDFEVSGNRQVVSKELALEASPTLRLKPLCCVYTPTSDYENKNDHFNNHGVCSGKDRDGNDVVTSTSIAIGTSTETGGYIGTVIVDGVEKEALLCDFMVWVEKYPDIVQLINEMWEQGIPLKSSCEYLYRNYEVKDGVQYVLSPLIFTSHCLLQSGENDTGKVDPAYNSSQLLSFNEKWEKAVSQAIINQNSLESVDNKEIDINSKNSQEEEILVNENKLYTALCELSYGDTRYLLMTELSKIMTADEFNSVWVSQYDIFDTYFIFERYFDDEYHYFKVSYTKTETEVTVDKDSIEEVKREAVWVSVENMQTAVNEIQTKLTDVETQFNAITEELRIANEQIETLNSEKETLTTQFNEASETIVSLNSQVEEMKPVVEQFNANEAEKALNEKKDYYEQKFKAVNGLDTYNSDEVQELLAKSINENDEGKDAILALNSKLVDLVTVKVDEPTLIKEYSSKVEKLIPIATDFDTRYQK